MQHVPLVVAPIVNCNPYRYLRSPSLVVTPSLFAIPIVSCDFYRDLQSPSLITTPSLTATPIVSCNPYRRSQPLPFIATPAYHRSQPHSLIANPSLAARVAVQVLGNKKKTSRSSQPIVEGSAQVRSPRSKKRQNSMQREAGEGSFRSCQQRFVPVAAKVPKEHFRSTYVAENVSFPFQNFDVNVRKAKSLFSAKIGHPRYCDFSLLRGAGLHCCTK